MTKAKSAKNFGTAFIPLVLNLIFRRLDPIAKSQNATLLVEMGKTQSQLPFKGNLNPTYSPAFGSWYNSNPLFARLPKKNFTFKEMNGLYGSLLDPVKFGPFTNETLLNKCTAGTLTKECGLAINLMFIQNANLNNTALGLIQALLCPNATVACFDISSVGAVGLFIKHLPNVVMSYLDNNNYGLTTTLKQSELTLGYVMKNLPFPPEYPTGVPVPGTVTSHAQESDVKKNSTFYTCETTVGKRFTYAGTRFHLSNGSI